MTRRSSPKHVPFFDLFKLIIAILLTLILILLLLNDQPQTVIFAPLPTATMALTVVAPTLSATPLPTPTVRLNLTTQIFATSDPDLCPSSPSHVQVGDDVRVLSWLNFRTGPGLQWPVILTNRSGIVMEVVGGPVCTTRDTAQGPKAYLWWSVRMDNGQEGWSAEAPLIDPIYLLEPIQ